MTTARRLAVICLVLVVAPRAAAQALTSSSEQAALKNNSDPASQALTNGSDPASPAFAIYPDQPSRALAIYPDQPSRALAIYPDPASQALSIYPDPATPAHAAAFRAARRRRYPSPAAQNLSTYSGPAAPSLTTPQDAPGQSTWLPLPNAPYVSRHNDVYFASPDTGWVVNGDGEIFRTTDGGARWSRQLFRSTAHFRSVGFVNARRGWAGNVGLDEFGASDPNALYETSDGGATWAPVTSFDGPTPTGLCGMFVVNDSVIVAVGRVRGPAVFVRTTNGGRTWQTRNMSEHAAGLIDAYFPHPDSGFVVGLTNEDHDSSAGIVLFTSDGGETWTPRHRTSQIGQWAWKISFPSRRVGYVSLQRNERAPIFFLKTTDGGESWSEKFFSEDYYFVQGIGFVSETHGWIGGNSTQPAFETNDGGETWQPANIGSRLNRFRFLNDSLGYAVGRTVHKFVADPSGVGSEAPPEVASIPGIEAFPNPSSGGITIRYTLEAPAYVTLSVYDALGRRVARLNEGGRPAGTHELSWAADLAPGTYLFQLQTPDGGVGRRLITVR